MAPPAGSQSKLTSYSNGPQLRSFLHGQIFGTVPPVTASEIKSQSFSNLTVIITGANTGLGFDAAKQLLQLGCVKRLILACRSLERGQKAKQVLAGIKVDGAGAATPTSIIEVWELDMANLKSIQAFADRCSRELDRIDSVVLNAGVHLRKQERVAAEDGGFETTIMVNVVGTFVLACLMVDVLRGKNIHISGNGNTQGRVTPPRITIVGSAVQLWAKYQPLVDGAQSQRGVLKWLSDEKRWDGDDRYYLSKGIVQMLVTQLARRINEGKEKGKDMVILNCAAPGYCRTELFRDHETFPVRLSLKLIGRDADIGARSLVVGAVGEKGGIKSHGGYMSEGVSKDPCSWFDTKQGEDIGRMMWDEVLEILGTVKPEAVRAL